MTLSTNKNTPPHSNGSQINQPEIASRRLPGGPAVKTLCCQCKGNRFNPGQGTKITHATWPKNKTTTTICVYIYIIYIYMYIWNQLGRNVCNIYNKEFFLEDSMMDDGYKDRNLGAVRLETKISFAYQDI